MAKARGPRRRSKDTPAEPCLFCRLSEKLDSELERHSGVVEHLTSAKRELLEAVREFVDNELESLERVLQKRKRRGRGKRVTRVEVEG